MSLLLLFNPVGQAWIAYGDPTTAWAEAAAAAALTWGEVAAITTAWGEETPASTTWGEQSAASTTSIWDEYEPA